MKCAYSPTPCILNRNAQRYSQYIALRALFREVKPHVSLDLVSLISLAWEYGGLPLPLQLWEEERWGYDLDARRGLQWLWCRTSMRWWERGSHNAGGKRNWFCLSSPLFPPRNPLFWYAQIELDYLLSYILHSLSDSLARVVITAHIEYGAINWRPRACCPPTYPKVMCSAQVHKHLFGSSLHIAPHISLNLRFLPLLGWSLLSNLRTMPLVHI